MSTYTWTEASNAGELNVYEARDSWQSALDPYLIWAYVTNFEHLTKPFKADGRPGLSYIPVTIELNEVSVPDFIRYIDMSAVPQILQISDLYRYTPAALEEAHYLTAHALTPLFFDHLLPGGILSDKIKRFELGLAVEPSQEVFSQATNFKSEPKYLADDLPMSQMDINLCVIDDGIGFINRTVMAKDGTSRLKYFWCQNEFPSEAAGKLDSTKLKNGVTSDFLTDVNVAGWQIGAQEIQQWLAAVEQNKIGEASVYRAYEYHAVGQSVSHGTHIMDIAAGLDNEIDATFSYEAGQKLDSTKIVAVQLGFPTRKFADSSGRWLSYGLLDAVRYSLLRGDLFTDTTGKVKPMVVNISMGNLAGPHDGSAMFESALDEIMSLRNNSIDERTKQPRKNNIIECVISAGNQRGARSHTKFTVEPTKQKTVIWRALPDDSTPSFLELWIPETHTMPDDCHDVVLEIEPPTGGRHLSGELKCGETWTLDKDGTNQCVVVYLPPIKLGTGKNGMILVALAPTNDVFSTSSILAGEWKVTIKNKGAKQLAMSAWIQRDETTFDRPARGRQSRFVDERFEPYDKFGYPRKNDDDNNSYIRLEGTVSAIATGSNSMTIGAYRYSDGAERSYSGLGGAGIKEAKPLAVADDSVMCRGILASGTHSGGRVALDGTSVAAAQAARSILSQNSLTISNDRINSSPAEIKTKQRRLGHRKR